MVPSVIQDPIYSNRDKEFLRSLDFEPVNDPDAYGRIDANTLVFNTTRMSHTYWFMSKGLRPAAIIGQDTTKGAEYGEPEFMTHFIRTMLKDYEFLVSPMRMNLYDLFLKKVRSSRHDFPLRSGSGACKCRPMSLCILFGFCTCKT